MLQQRRQRLRRSEWIIDERRKQPEPGTPRGRVEANPPARVRIDQLDRIERRRPLAPAELRFGRVGMRRHAEAAEPPDVFDDVARLAGKGERRIVAAGCADFDAIEAKDPGSVRRRIRCARAVAVVGEGDELQARPSGGGGDLVRTAAAVRAAGVNVETAGDGAVGPRRQGEARRRDGRDDQRSGSGCEGRRHENPALHESRARAPRLF